MIDITKEDFSRVEGYLEIEKVPKKENKIKMLISKNKFMTVATALYVAFATINLFLVYYFFKLFSKL